MTDISKISSLDDLAEIIRHPRDLSTLCHALNRFDELCERHEPDMLDSQNEYRWRRVDLCALSTFGGDEPSDTMNIFSWDADSLMWGDGHWYVEPRIN